MICAPINILQRKSSCGVGSLGEIESLCVIFGICVVCRLRQSPVRRRLWQQRHCQMKTKPTQYTFKPYLDKKYRITFSRRKNKRKRHA